MGRRLFAGCVLLAATVLIAGCGGSQSSPPSPAMVPQANAIGTQGVASALSAAAASAPYRHGLVPMLGTAAAARAFVEAISSKDLHYNGGLGGVGVLTGTPRVYLVFWGTQWGTQSTNGAGYTTFSGDPQGLAPDLQAFFKGLGTGTEEWSGIVTQYCDGVAVGATKCPTTTTPSSAEAGFPTGGALAGVWEDTSAASPTQSTGHELAVEAEKAAKHFGFTTESASIHNVYIIVSPTGTNPDNYQGQGFCAWHDYTGDGTLDGGGGASGPLMNFTNLPYVPDAGAGCGAGFVNPGNVLDGVTIVSGHEYAETLTDEFPAGGWTAAGGAYAGEEIGDLCAWLTSGAGKSQNLVLTTGTFAVQGLWSNRANKGFGGCVIKQAQL